MKQADLWLNLKTKRTRKREFLAHMERVQNQTGISLPKPILFR